MAGFEVIVRPVVFPSIRPPPARSLPPEDDPEKGIAVLSGSAGRLIDLSHSVSQSMSKSKPQEVERRVDEMRVFQEENDGTVNRDNYVDIDVANKITMDETTGGRGTEGVGTGTEGVGSDLSEQQRKEWREYFYATSKIARNIEMLAKDKIKKNNAYIGGTSW